MTIQDYESIKNILEVEFDEFWTPSVLKTELENLNSKYIVATINNEIVGFAGIIYNFDYVEIMNIVTKKSMRRQGIASSMLKKLILMAEEYGTNRICLEVNEKNKSAIELYKKNGFQNVGTRKKYD